jgi:hypothetical protein
MHEIIGVMPCPYQSWFSVSNDQQNSTDTVRMTGYLSLFLLLSSITSGNCETNVHQEKTLRNRIGMVDLVWPEHLSSFFMVMLNDFRLEVNN